MCVCAVWYSGLWIHNASWGWRRTLSLALYIYIAFFLTLTKSGSVQTPHPHIVTSPGSQNVTMRPSLFEFKCPENKRNHPPHTHTRNPYTHTHNLLHILYTVRFVFQRATICRSTLRTQYTIWPSLYPKPSVGELWAEDLFDTLKLNKVNLMDASQKPTTQTAI